MRTRFVPTISTVLFAAVLASSSACGPGRPSFSPHELAVLEATEAAVRLFRQDPGAAWPGYDLARQPFLIYIPNIWALLINAPAGKPVKGFTLPPSGWPDLGAPYLYHAGQYEDLVGQLAFAFPVGDLEVAAIGVPEGLVPGQSFPHPGLVDFIIHENFHEFQDKNFGEIPWEREERYPILDARNTALAFLEMAVLKDALEPLYSRDRAKVEDAVRLFSAVRSERWARGPSFVKRYEQGQEIREGTAQYVQMKCADLLKDLDYRSSVNSRNVHDALSGFSPLAIRNNDFETRMKGQTIVPDDMIRNRIYPVGATLGLMADFLGLSWKGPAQRAGPDFAFHEILSAAMPPGGPSAPALLDEAKRRYGYEPALAAAKASGDSYREEFGQALKTFESQAGIRVEMDFSYARLSRSRVGAGRKWVVDDGARTLGLTYRVYTLKNDGLALETRETAVFESDDWDAKAKKAAFFAPEISSLTIDGAAVPPGSPLSRRFSTVEIRGPNFSVRTTVAGDLTVSGRTVRIVLDRP